MHKSEVIVEMIPAILNKHKILFFALLLAAVLMPTTVFSSSISSISIRFSGAIITSEVMALNGSAQAIQTAVNQVAAAGGGTVRVPAGTFTFTIDPFNIGTNNGPCGVVIPGGVNVIGAGADVTILNCPTTSWASHSVTYSDDVMFALDGSNNLPSRISGITFKGSVYQGAGASDDTFGLTGILIMGTRDFRIDNCNFQDFTRAAICAWNNWAYNPNGNCGVIDHCNIDNPYKNTFYANTGEMPLWGYGIQVGGPWPNTAWDDNYANWFGKYHHDIVYIEDCTLSRCRHAVAGIPESWAFYVLRHCTLTDMVVAGYGSYQDVHGGGQGAECYNNIIINTPLDARSTGYGTPGTLGKYMGIGFYPRGGYGLIYNNDIRYFNDGTAIVLANDGGGWSSSRLHGQWIWGNMYTNMPGNAAVSLPTSQIGTSPGNYPITMNTDYFLRAPAQAQDGFTYTPYPYPHPLTSVS